MRRIPRGSATAAPLVSASPRANGSALAAASPSLLANFNGVSSRDSAVTNFGQEFEPPDQGLCVGNGFVVEMVNSAYTVYRPDGSVVTGPFNVNGPFDEGLTEFTSDPRCQYDAATHTWFATILFINSASTQSRLDVAVNTSGDPTTPWTDYQIDTTGLGGKTGPKDPGCPCFGDQPTLGIDAFNVYVTTNEFSILGPQFNGAQIYAIAKKDLVAAGPTATPAHFVHFDKLSIGGAVANSIQPALTSGNPAAEYFLNSLDPNGTFDQRVGVWALTNRGVVATGGTPTLSSLVLGSEAYGIPPGAQQKGASSLLDAGDDRMQQTQFINGDVWGELDTSVTVPNDSAARAGAAWFDVHPSLSNGVLGAACRSSTSPSSTSPSTRWPTASTRTLPTIQWVADRLHAGAGHGHPADRLGRRPVRHQAPLHDLDRAVRGRLGALRGLAWSSALDIALPRAAGPRRRHADAARHDDPDPRGGPAADRPGDGDPRRADAAGPDPRPDPRRLADRRRVAGAGSSSSTCRSASSRWSLCSRILPGDAAAARTQRLDFVDLLLLSPGLALAIYGLAETELGGRLRLGQGAGRRCRPGSRCSARFVAARACAPADPLIDLRLFKRPHLRHLLDDAGAGRHLRVRAFLLLPLYFQAVRGESPLQAGCCWPRRASAR